MIIPGRSSVAVNTQPWFRERVLLPEQPPLWRTRSAVFGGGVYQADVQQRSNEEQPIVRHSGRPHFQE